MGALNRRKPYQIVNSPVSSVAEQDGKHYRLSDGKEVTCTETPDGIYHFELKKKKAPPIPPEPAEEPEEPPAEKEEEEEEVKAEAPAKKANPATMKTADLQEALSDLGVPFLPSTPRNAMVKLYTKAMKNK